MGDKVDVFFPWFFGDYLKDTTDLTMAEHGAYMLLLGHMWNRGGHLPSDPDRLARLLGTDGLSLGSLWPALSRFFTASDDGYTITQRRLLAELEKATLRKKTAKENGQKGGRPRSLPANDENPNETQTEPMNKPNGEPKGKAKKSSPSPSPSPSPSATRDPDQVLLAGTSPIIPDNPSNLIHVFKREVEKTHPELGMWSPGTWGTKDASKFFDDIPKTDRATKATIILARIRAYLAEPSKDGWTLRGFFAAFNRLGNSTAPRRNPVQVPADWPRSERLGEHDDAKGNGQ